MDVLSARYQTMALPEGTIGQALDNKNQPEAMSASRSGAAVVPATNVTARAQQPEQAEKSSGGAWATVRNRLGRTASVVVGVTLRHRPYRDALERTRDQAPSGFTAEHENALTDSNSGHRCSLSRCCLSRRG